MGKQLCIGTTITGKAVPRGAQGQPRAVGGTAASPKVQTGDFPEAAGTGDIIRGANGPRAPQQFTDPAATAAQ